MLDRQQQKKKRMKVKHLIYFPTPLRLSTNVDLFSENVRDYVQCGW